MKRWISFLLTLILAVNLFAGVPVQGATYYDSSTAVAYNQYSSPWASLYYGSQSIGVAGCGILSTTNALNYMSGTFNTSDKAYAFIQELAAYAYSIDAYNGSLGGGTARYYMFSTNITDPPALEYQFGSQYSFTMPVYWTENWNSANYYNGSYYNNIYVNTQTTLKTYLAGDSVAIAHVPGHFICLADYDSSTDMFLVLDSAPTTARGTGNGVAWISADNLSGGLPALTVGGYCVLSATATTAVSDTLMLYNGESTDGLTAAFGASLTTDTSSYTQGTSSLKMTCTTPNAYASSHQVGGMVLQSLSSATDMSAYDTLAFDLYLPTTMTGSHVFQVNFAVGAQDGYNFAKYISNQPAGWYTVQVPLAEIPVAVASTADWTKTDTIRYTWFNYGGFTTETSFLLDNVRLLKDDTDILAKGIDVSKWQGDIDWEAVANDPHGEFAIIRAGYNGLKTTKFEDNYAGAKAAGVPIGAYAYIMATTVEEARAEANALVEILAGKQFEYPIYIDVEDPDVYGSLDKATVTEIVKTEVDILEAAGYFAGIYTYYYFTVSNIDMTALTNYSFWIAQLGSSTDYTGSYGMWQYSAKGMIEGISGPVDLDYCYVDFPSIIKSVGLNGYGEEDKVAAVETLIDSLPAVDDITVDDEEQIVAAREAYEALTDTQKALVENLATLEAAETALEQAKEDAAGIVAKGIDVSKWQGDIDWQAVANDPHGEFAIIRAAYGGEKTTKFEDNYAGAKAAGVPIGAYAYIMATTVEEATAEANAILEIIAGKQFEYPIYLDVEDAVYTSMDVEKVTEIVKTEAAILEAAGYFTGIYSYYYFTVSYLDMTALTAYTAWIAEYNDSCSYTGAYAMWQYSCTGAVSGISGDVDLNYSYMDFPTIVKRVGLNGYGTDEQVTAVEEQIAALPAVEDLTLADKEAVVAAREAYDALTVTQKGRVESLATLEAAEAQIALLETYTPGDLNDDGAIDNKDLALMQRFLNDWEVAILEYSADVNRDGVIDNKDYSLLQRYLNGWAVELA